MDWQEKITAFIFSAKEPISKSINSSRTLVTIYKNTSLRIRQTTLFVLTTTRRQIQADFSYLFFVACIPFRGFFTCRLKTMKWVARAVWRAWETDTSQSKRHNIPEDLYFVLYSFVHRPPLWSIGQSFRLQIQRSRVRFPALPDFLSSSGSGTGSTQPREVNWGATWIESSGSGPENRD